MTQQPPQGWFLKLRRTHDGGALTRHVTKAWSRRYFVMVRDRIKWYRSADPHSGEPPCGFINFQQVMRIRVLNSESRHKDSFNRDEHGTFSIEIDSHKRRLVIRTTDRDMAKFWVAELRRRLHIWTERTGVETIRELAKPRAAVDTRDFIMERIDRTLSSMQEAAAAATPQAARARHGNGHKAERQREEEEEEEEEKHHDEPPISPSAASASSGKAEQRKKPKARKSAKRTAKAHVESKVSSSTSRSVKKSAAQKAKKQPGQAKWDAEDVRGMCSTSSTSSKSSSESDLVEADAFIGGSMTSPPGPIAQEESPSAEALASARRRRSAPGGSKSSARSGRQARKSGKPSASAGGGTSGGGKSSAEAPAVDSEDDADNALREHAPRSKKSKGRGAGNGHGKKERPAAGGASPKVFTPSSKPLRRAASATRGADDAAWLEVDWN